MKSRFLLACAAAVALAGVGACGDSKTPTSATSGTSATTVTTPGGGGSGTGQLIVKMKDAPVDAQALLVNISEVSVHLGDTETADSWKSMPMAGGMTCDLLQMQDNAIQTLGTMTLTAGHYTQIRLTVTEAKVYLDKFTTLPPACVTPTAFPTVAENVYPVKIPSGTIKLNRQFTIESGTATTLLLDFDAAQSLKKLGNGNYQMSPVISVVSVQ